MNAIVKRYFYAKFRPRRITAIVLAYIAFLLFILWAIWLARYPDFSNIIFNEWSETLFFIQYLLVFVGGFFLTAQEIYKERLQKSIVFFESLPLTPMQKLRGMILGSNLTNFLLILITIPMAVISALTSGGHLYNITATYIVFIPGIFLASLIGFLVTLSADRLYRPSGSFFLFIIIIMFIGLCTPMGMYVCSPANPFVLLLPNVYYGMCFGGGKGAVYTISFFGWKWWAPIYTAFMYLYFGYWITLASLRKIESEESSLLSLGQAVIFFLLTGFIFSGFMWDTHSSEGELLSFHLVTLFNLFLALFIISLFVKDYKAYLVSLGGPKKIFDIRKYPLLIGLVFWAYLFLLSIVSFWMPFKELPLIDFLLYFLNMGLFLALFITVMEFFAITLKERGKALGWIIVVILCIAPLILAKASGDSVFMVASPVGTEILHSTSSPESKIEDIAMSFAYTVAGIVVVKILSLDKHRMLMRIRKRMKV